MSRNEIIIKSYLKKEVEEGRTPSVQYFLFNKDSFIYKFKFGYSNIKNQSLIDEHTTYNAFSVTKTFTALAILQLNEQKLVDLEDPVIMHLPDFLYAPDITILQLLTHSSGIPNPIPLSWIHLASEHDSFDSHHFFDNIMLKNSKVNFKPNDKYAYSNLGYIILGQLIEKISGLRYEDYINNMIIKKLNLKPEDLGFNMRNQNFHAVGYHKKLSFTNTLLGFFIDKSKYMAKSEGNWKPFHKFYVNGNAYGGLIGSPTGFVKYSQELLKSNSILLSDNFKRKLFNENYTNRGKATGMCLSWFKGNLNGNTYFAHAGGGGGYYSEIRLYPELGIGSIIMFNRTGMSDERYLDKLDKFYFK